MFIYILLVSIAALIQIATIYLLRQQILQSLLWAIPLIIVCQLLFLYSYSKAPKFLLIWFITTAITNSLAFLVGYFVWKEQVSWYNLVGVGIILLGIFLLRF